MRPVNIAGKTYGRLKAVSRTGSKNGKSEWLFECVCGEKRELIASRVISGGTKSCGCLKSESSRATSIKNIKHGETGALTYNSWIAMRNRCDNTNHKDRASYGGRGIGYAAEWSDYRKFKDDMGERPSKDYTLDRIDVDKGYSKSNCRWATRHQQSRNRRDNAKFTFKGKTLCATDWAKELGICHSSFIDRALAGKTGESLFKHGKISIREANRKLRLIKIDGVERHLYEWARIYKIKPGTISARLHRGWSGERAVKEQVK